MPPTDSDYAPDSLGQIFDDLLIDQGVHIGQPIERKAAVRRLVTGAKLDAGDAKVIRWYFDHIAEGGSVTNMGAFVAKRVSTTENIRDLVKGARKLRDKATFATEKPAGMNMSRDPGQEQRQSQIVREFVTGHNLNRGHVCRAYNCDDEFLEAALLANCDILFQFARTGPEDLREECQALGERYRAQFNAS